MKDLPTCEHCDRPMRPVNTKLSDYPDTVLRRREGCCYSCFKRGGKPPTHKKWDSLELFAEIDHLNAPPEETCQRLNITASAVSQAGYRHGRRDLALIYGRIARAAG